MKNVWFRVAERLLQVSLPNGSEWKSLLPSFASFSCCCLAEEGPMCTLRVVTKQIEYDGFPGVLLADFPQMSNNRFRLIETSTAYVVEIQSQGEAEWYRMVSDKRFSSAQAYVGRAGHLSGTALNGFLMALFAQAAVLHRVFLIHSSVVAKEGKGYAFLGKSGTGKSTHSALWIEHLEGVELINDDNPAIEIADDGKVYVYGTPWSGKTPCYKNQKIELVGCVRLRQSSVNQFTRQVDAEAFTTVLPSCSSIRWNDELFGSLCNLLEQMIQRRVLVGCLACRADAQAAQLCYAEMVEIDKLE